MFEKKYCICGNQIKEMDGKCPECGLPALFGHKQIEVVIIDDIIFTVDEGLEEIIKNLWYWGIITCNSCIDNINDSTWIQFADFSCWDEFLKLALDNEIIINGNGYLRDTLWNFIENESYVKLHSNEDIILDPNDDNNVIGTGILRHSVSLRFPKKHLDKFQNLLFEVLPPE